MLIVRGLDSVRDRCDPSFDVECSVLVLADLRIADVADVGIELHVGERRMGRAPAHRGEPEKPASIASPAKISPTPP